VCHRRLYPDDNPPWPTALCVCSRCPHTSHLSALVASCLHSGRNELLRRSPSPLLHFTASWETKVLAFNWHWGSPGRGHCEPGVLSTGWRQAIFHLVLLHFRLSALDKTSLLRLSIALGADHELYEVLCYASSTLSRYLPARPCIVQWRATERLQ
jgi:hypothetical protein